ncbi:hypothetical protein NVP1052A_33 [Vibrio phage 1.052.A._10N.286.46.C3]|nr:hypothetical protein NVP1052A_33 [Vibrio phage 1.052.A._10N.286.46.C3]
MNIEQMIRKNIKQYLIDDGCDPSVAAGAADKGVDFFNQGNHKDPFFDSLCHAGVCHAQVFDKKYKFKKPKKVGGKPFTYSKPQSRKIKKDTISMF